MLTVGRSGSCSFRDITILSAGQGGGREARGGRCGGREALFGPAMLERRATAAAQRSVLQWCARACHCPGAHR